MDIKRREPRSDELQGSKNNGNDRTPVPGNGPAVNGRGVQMILSALQRAAESYARRGLRVMPCRERTTYGPDTDSTGKPRRHGAKSPYTRHGCHDGTTDLAQLRAWWSQWPDAAIGIATGGGIMVVDVDMHGDVDGMATWDRVCADHGGVPQTRTARTPSGGIHLYYRVPVGVRIRCSAGGIGPGVDIRGDGGYVVAPPSAIETGSYLWIGDRPMADAPQWLVDMCMERPRPEREACHTVEATESSWYGLAALEAEALELSECPEGLRNAKLNEAAFAVGQLVAGGELEESEALTALEDAARVCGLDSDEIEKTLRSGFRAGKEKPRSASACETDSDPESSELPEFVDFDELPPDLPAGLLPGILGEFSEGLAHATQTPRELAAVNALGVVALAVQNKVIARVKADYSEGLNIYGIVASEPGERKSAVVSACKAPLVEWEIVQEAFALDEIRTATSLRKTMEKAIEKARAKVASAKTAEERRRIAEEVQLMERELPEVPTLPRLLVDDATPEALAALMAGCGESVGLLEAEGGILDTLSGRYSSGVPNIDLFLKAFGGEPVVIDRKGKDPIRLRKPRLTMILTPQPSVLRAAGGNEVFMGRGLIARCLLVLPRPLVGYRDNSQSIPPELTRKWAAFVGSLLAIPGQEKTHELTLSPEAYALWLDFSGTVEMAQRPGGEFEFLRGWASKLTGLVVRLAALMHMAGGHTALQVPIGLDTMRSAVLLATWAAEHAKHAYSCFGADDGQEVAKRALAWIRKKRPETVTARDILRALRGRFPTMDQIRPGLAVLVDRGALVELARKSATGKGGRPSETYHVNPAVFEG